MPNGTLEPIRRAGPSRPRTSPHKLTRPHGPPIRTSRATWAAAARPAATIEPAPQGAATFTQARTAHEIAKAQRARIQVQRLREEVVDRG